MGQNERQRGRLTTAPEGPRSGLPCDADFYFFGLKLIGANVGDEEFTFEKPTGVNFDDATFDDVKVTPTDFVDVKFTPVDFGDVKFTAVDFGDVKFTGVKLGDMLLDVGDL